MDNDSLIYLDNVKTSYYEKNIDLINVHVYVKEVDNCEILFEESKVICKFSTKDSHFLKLHAASKKLKHASFCYIIETRQAIDCSGCKYVVKTPFIEVILKKKVPQKWNGLHILKASSKPSQLLGGKSTPMKTNDEKKQEVDTNQENSASSSSKTEDERNIKKAVTSQPENLAGLTGLENYANNCYMNVVIQILANIQETRDYFKNDHYLKDVNANNPLSSGGKVAKAFADVIKALWSFRKNAFKPIALKNIMGKRYSLFLGWQQHDAQEFFASLLDNLHEDLNQSYSHCEKGAESTKVELESAVNEKPDTAWSAHVKRNNSFIVKLFHGQLMSKLTCAACHKVSYSYDPCASISLPIPTTKHNLSILYFTRDVYKPPLLVPMQISTPNAKVWHLINMLQSIVKVPSHLLTIFNGIHSVCVDAQAPLLSVHKYKYVIANEISSKDEVEFISIPVFQYVLHSGLFVHCDNCFTLQSSTVRLKRCTRCFVVAYCSRDCQTKHWHVHGKTCNKDLKMQVGVPFYVTLRKESLTFETLEETLRDRAKCSVELFSTTCVEENNNQSGDEATDCSKQMQRLSLASSAVCVIKTSTKPTDDESSVIINCDNFSVDLLVKTPYLIVEWQNTPEEGDISSNIKTKCVPVHEICKRDCDTGVTEEEDQCSVYDCLRLFMEPESLDERDSWKCPKCKSLQSAKKEMALSSPPGVLLLHLKRFTYGDFGQKINKSVSYPLSNFDLSPFVAKETRSKIEHPLIYDLCGIITHSGSMRMGHYTCIVRMLGQEDQEEIGWRFFDDDSVRKIKSDKVICPDAYVLVYRLQGAQEILKSGSTENATKRKCADGASSNPNVEKLSKCDGLDYIKRSVEVNYDEHANVDKEQVAGASSSFDNVNKTECSASFPVDSGGQTSAVGEETIAAHESVFDTPAHESVFNTPAHESVFNTPVMEGGDNDCTIKDELRSFSSDIETNLTPVCDTKLSSDDCLPEVMVDTSFTSKQTDIENNECTFDTIHNLEQSNIPSDTTNSNIDSIKNDSSPTRDCDLHHILIKDVADITEDDLD